MRRKYKVLFTLILCIILSLSTSMMSLASNKTDFKQMSEYKDITTFTQKIARISNTHAISEPKSQTKTAYLTTAGTNVGTVSLYYRTDIIGGRPQFLYDYCTFGENFSSYYAISLSNINFSSDKITLTYSAQMGLLYDTVVVSFYP